MKRYRDPNYKNFLVVGRMGPILLYASRLNKVGQQPPVIFSMVRDNAKPMTLIQARWMVSLCLAYDPKIIAKLDSVGRYWETSWIEDIGPDPY